jgi:integrase
MHRRKHILIILRILSTTPGTTKGHTMPTVNDIAAAFLGQCVEHKSPATVKHYTKRLKPFLVAFGSREFAELLPIEIMAYMREVNRFAVGHKKAGQLKANATRTSNAIVLELLESFAVDELRCVVSRVLPKLDKPIGRQREELPTDDQVKLILKHATPAFAKIYKALRQTGARPGELAGATFDHWHRELNEIVLAQHKTAAKTGEVRRIAVGKRFEKILLDSVGNRAEGHLFLNSAGKPWTVETLDKNFSRIRTAAGLPSSLVLYCTRHEHATRLCEKVGIEDAADALGHKSINTTKRYIHKDRKRLADNQDLMDQDAA